MNFNQSDMLSPKLLMNAIHWFALVVVWISTTSAGLAVGVVWFCLHSWLRHSCGKIIPPRPQDQQAWLKSIQPTRAHQCIVHSLMFYGVRIVGEFPYFSMVKSYNHRCHTKILYGTSGWKVIQPLVPYKNFIWLSEYHWSHINFLYGTSGCMTFQPLVPYKIFVWHQWLYDFPKLLMNAIH